jgi:chaperonin cofactor prefoldin
LKSLLEEKEVQLEIHQSDNLFFAYKKFESIIVTLDVLCFKHGTPMDQFFERVRELYLQLDSLGISVERLPEYLEDQKKEILRLQSEIKNEVEQQGATMHLLREYQTNIPAYRSAKNELEIMTKERDSCRSELDYVREKITKKFGRRKKDNTNGMPILKK